MDFPLPHAGPWLAGQIAERLGSRRAPERLLAAGLVTRLARGLYYEADRWASMPPDERHLVLLAAHYEFHAQIHRGSFVYSHLSAARAHGLHLWDADGLIHLTAPTARGGGRHRPEVRLHTGTFDDGDLTDVKGLPVTSLERTTVDSARWLRRGQAQIVVDHALRLGATRGRLEELLRAAAGRRGIRTAQAAVALGSPLSESPGESLLNFLVSTMPVPRPQQQIEVVTRAGLYRIDTGWPAIRRGLEFDGRAKYFAYAPTDEAIFQERQREKALFEEGWQLLRIEWRDLFREVELRERIMRLLGSPAGGRVAA